MIRLLLPILKHISALMPGIATDQPEVAPKILAQRREQLVRIQRVMEEHFGRSLSLSEQQRFLQVGTLAPLTRAKPVSPMPRLVVIAHHPRTCR
ncbi:MAG TPA: hypothetical protein VKU02_24040 [Gemmataceae bacterium]|nr:hypothetical protein [Gemmataceae bacterium]